MTDLLGDLRVVELAQGIAGPYCGKLFVDAGARVVKVEAAALDESSGDALFAYLNAGKDRVVGTLDDADVERWVGECDVVVVDETMSNESVARLAAQYPALVICSVTPFGRDDGLLERPWSDFIVQAASSALGWRGDPQRYPVQIGGRIGEWIAGCHAAPIALGAAMQAVGTGIGRVIDVSMCDALAIAGTNYTHIGAELLGDPQPVGPARMLETPAVEPASDGWVGFNTNSGAHFEMFCVMIGHPEVATEWATLASRFARLREWEALVHEWTTRHTVDEILAVAGELRVPAAPVHSGRTVLDDPHLVARGAFVPNPAGFQQPRRPYLVDGQPPPAIREVSELAATVPQWKPRKSSTTIPATPDQGGEGSRRLPLEGIRVVDLTSWWAGPSATQILGFLGAEVIHVESPRHPDGMRAIGFYFGREPWWEGSSMFLGANSNKLDVTLDLSDPRGVALFHQLVAESDAVVENFAPRVLDQFGISWDSIQRANPKAILMRMPGFGLTGPWRERVGFAQTMEQMSGIAWVTGYPGDRPLIARGVCDPIAAAHGAFALLAALAHREETGRGMFVESTMIEAALNCSAEAIIEWSAHGVELDRDANRSRHCCPQGVFRCVGDDQWVAVSVADDPQWVRLARAIGREDLAEDPKLARADGRRTANDELEAMLSGWTATQTVEDVVKALTAASVPVSALADARTLRHDPALTRRALYELVDHPAMGPIHLPGLPCRMTGVDRWVRTPTPMLGEHNSSVLGGLLGVSPEGMAELAAADVIGTKPLGT